MPPPKHHLLRSAALLPVFATLTLQAGKWMPSYAGPYMIQVSRMYNCPDSVQWDPEMWFSLRTSHWNPYKPAELQIVDGNVSSVVDIVNEHWLKVTCDVRNNNQWKPNFLAHLFKKDSCSILVRLFPDVIKAIFGDNNARASPCVLPMGNYSIANRPIDWSIRDIPLLPYGTYRLHVQSGHPGRALPYLCLSLEGTAFPRQQAPTVPAKGGSRRAA